MKLIVRLLFMITIVATFVGAGTVVLVLVNAAPILILGGGIGIISPYFTIIPSIGMAAGAAFSSAILAARWLRPFETQASDPPTILQLLYSMSAIVGVTFAGYIAFHGFYPEKLNIAWQEEIRLANGSLLDIDRRMELKRYEFKIEKYKADVKFHELRFRSGPQDLEIHVRTSLTPIYLNQIDGNWYLVVTHTDGAADAGRGENWGQENTKGQWLAILDGNSFRPLDWKLAPDAIIINNLISTRQMDLQAIDSLPARRLSSIEKRRRLYEYVAHLPGPDHLLIARHYTEKRYMRAEYKAALRSLESE